MQKVLLVALLFCWPFVAFAETTAEIRFFPKGSSPVGWHGYRVGDKGFYDDDLKIYLSDAYTLMLRTDTTNSSQAPTIRFSLQCTSGDQDYYASITLNGIIPNISSETMSGTFRTASPASYPARLTSETLDISSIWEWSYYDNELDNLLEFRYSPQPEPLHGNLEYDPDTMMLIAKALTDDQLLIGVFGFIYDFDLSNVRSIITGFHQKCAIVHGN